MKTGLRLSILPAALLLAGCGWFNNTGLTVGERQLLDVRHDHLRCEVKLDRLRHLYELTPEERGGVMDNGLNAGNEMGDPSLDSPLTGGHDAPLTGGHDAPLTGGHDAPLTGGHDAPLTGGHDYADALRGATKVAADACWDTVAVLVNRYNVCVVEFLECRDNEEGDCYDPKYKECLEDNRPPPPT